MLFLQPHRNKKEREHLRTYHIFIHCIQLINTFITSTSFVSLIWEIIINLYLSPFTRMVKLCALFNFQVEKVLPPPLATTNNILPPPPNNVEISYTILIARSLMLLTIILLIICLILAGRYEVPVLPLFS